MCAFLYYIVFYIININKLYCIIYVMCMCISILQGFQEAVAESAGRLNDLLQRGEELIQRSEPKDAQAIENQLQELLLHCTRVFQGLGRLHTRLLSMRLVHVHMRS